jgi:hypothetical protein
MIGNGRDRQVPRSQRFAEIRGGNQIPATEAAKKVGFQRLGR